MKSEHIQRHECDRDIGPASKGVELLQVCAMKWSQQQHLVQEALQSEIVREERRVLERKNQNSLRSLLLLQSGCCLGGVKDWAQVQWYRVWCGVDLWGEQLVVVVVGLRIVLYANHNGHIAEHNTAQKMVRYRKMLRTKHKIDGTMPNYSLHHSTRSTTQIKTCCDNHSLHCLGFEMLDQRYSLLLMLLLLGLGLMVQERTG